MRADPHTREIPIFSQEFDSPVLRGRRAGKMGIWDLSHRGESLKAHSSNSRLSSFRVCGLVIARSILPDLSGCDRWKNDFEGFGVAIVVNFVN
jgi:hypothetical protein